MDILAYAIQKKLLGSGGTGGGGESKPITLQDKTFTENGTYTADEGFDGLGVVVVEVGGGGEDEVLDEVTQNYINFINQDHYPIFPEGMTEIKRNACSNYVFMYGVTLPSDLISIGESAFNGCSNLVLTSLPDGVTNLGTTAFYKCPKLALTSLPNGIKTLAAGTFGYCTNLALTSLPEGLESIYDDVFTNCINMDIKRLPSKLSVLANRVFSGCSKMTEITFNSTPGYLGEYAFANCPNLKTINVPWSEGVKVGAPWGATNATVNYNYTEG